MTSTARDDLVEKAARAAHEANRVYCQALGDTSQPAWDKAPKWQQDSVMDGAGRLIDDPAISPKVSHESWMVRKLRDGWKYGPIKDPDKKEHPCMVPYKQMPPEQRAKDTIFRAVVLGVAGKF